LAVVCATRAPRKEWSIAILCSMTGALPGLADLIARCCGSGFTSKQIGMGLAVAAVAVPISYHFYMSA